MSTKTLIRSERPSETAPFPRSITETGDPTGADNELGDWCDPAMIAVLEVSEVGGEANARPEIDREWAALAKAAQTRWLRENPY